jgi:hypothetical protein
MSVTQLFPEFIRDDLAKSGLEIVDMNVRPLTSTERHATGSPQQPEGYVIPYRSISGTALPFYRVRLKGWDPKYKQLTDEPNHLYFPKEFWDEAHDAQYILFLEGEKKAVCAAKHGFAAVACGGVDSWSNKTVSLPKDAKLTKGRDGRIIAKLQAGDEAGAHHEELAVGMKELIDLIVKRDIPLIICYDSDDMGRVPNEVQAAAARLGYSLRFHGVPARNIRQFILQPPSGFLGDKLGFDDLLQSKRVTTTQVDQAIKKVIAKPSAFPRHPNPREYINKKLRRAKMTREQLQGLATSVLCDLDANGSRLYSKDEDDLYYFSRTSKRLMQVSFKLNENYAKSDWGVYLYQNYNLSAADERVLLWLEALYAGEAPVQAVNPERVIAIRDDAMYYQIGAAQMIKVTAKEIRVLDNGNDDILFLSDSSVDLDKGKLVEGINKLLEVETTPNYWFEVTSKARIADNANKSQARLLSYLYSISPWFYRWRGTQLPVEMVVGEPGSGKSTLYQIRLSILNGEPRLRNPAKDITDWGVSVGSTGGLHVTDNINMLNTMLRQQISDEMCRIVTEPKPTIEKRKLYTDNKTVLIPIKTVFAVTAVKQPFNAPDIIQRSVITYMNKGDEAVEYQGDWAAEQIAKFGGREGWMAQQLVFLHRMLKRAKKEWKSDYKAKMRLINFEQLLRLSARLYGDDDAWLVEYLESSQATTIADNDHILGALHKFAQACIDKHGEYSETSAGRFLAKDISGWALTQNDYKEIFTLTNSRALGKYLKDNPNLLATVAGITENGTKSNATAYHAHEPKT